MSDITPREECEARHTAMYQKRNGVARKLDLQLQVADGTIDSGPAAMSPVSRLVDNMEGVFNICSPHVPGSGVRQALRRQVSFPGMEHPAMSPPVGAQLPPQCPTFPHTSPLGEKMGSPTEVPGNKENNFSIGRRRPSGSRPIQVNHPKSFQRSNSMVDTTVPPLDFVESPIVVKAKKTKRCVSMDTSAGTSLEDMQIASSFNETRSSVSSLASSWEPASPPKMNPNDPVMDSPKCLLPTLANGSQPDLKSLSVDTVADLLDGKFRNIIDDYVIVDCRYPYEYAGGCIRNAVNLCNPIDSCNFFFKELAKAAKEKNLAIIIHCEFSTKRGPKMWRHIRNLDRKFNHDNYPNLFFKDMYLLEGGYKCFYEKYPRYCEPSHYVCMHDPNFSNELKDSTQSVRRSWAKTKQQTDELLRFSV